MCVCVGEWWGWGGARGCSVWCSFAIFIARFPRLPECQHSGSRGVKTWRLWVEPPNWWRSLLLTILWLGFHYLAASNFKGESKIQSLAGQPLLNDNPPPSTNVWCRANYVYTEGNFLKFMIPLSDQYVKSSFPENLLQCFKGFVLS